MRAAKTALPPATRRGCLRAATPAALAGCSRGTRWLGTQPEAEPRGSLVPETLAEMDSAGSEFQQNAAELRAMGKQRLSLQERKRRRRALDALGVPDFAAFLGQQGVSLPLRKEAVTMLQLNVGLLCNQACTHCHVESSPRRTEAMDERLDEKFDELREIRQVMTDQLAELGAQNYALDQKAKRGASACCWSIFGLLNLGV